MGFWNKGPAKAYDEAFKAFFDAYCRGGEKSNEPLVIDYDFFLRPGVKRELEKLRRSYTMDIEALLNEFEAHSSKPEKEEFIDNIEYFYLCFIKKAVKSFGPTELLRTTLFLRELLEMRLIEERRAIFSCPP